jgi:hypothetical protein
MPTGVYDRTLKLKPIFRPIGPSIAYVPLSRGMWSLIDLEDADLVGRYNWSACPVFSAGRIIAYYAKRHLRKGEIARTSERQCIHDLLMAKEGFEVDHVFSRETLDNRRTNLRFANRAQQLHNTRKHIDNTSGYKGVYRTNSNKWIATLMANGVTYRGHPAVDISDAVLDRQRLEREHHGAFVPAKVREA